MFEQLGVEIPNEAFDLVISDGLKKVIFLFGSMKMQLKCLLHPKCNELVKNGQIAFLDIIEVTQRELVPAQFFSSEAVMVYVIANCKRVTVCDKLIVRNGVILESLNEKEIAFLKPLTHDRMFYLPPLSDDRLYWTENKIGVMDHEFDVDFNRFQHASPLTVQEFLTSKPNYGTSKIRLPFIFFNNH